MASSLFTDLVDDAPPPSTAKLAKMKFESALAELEALIQNMENGQLPLEESIAAYRRGNDLLKHCQTQLSDAEQKIQLLEAGVLRELDTSLGDVK